jgi:hypothetical protein
MSADVLSRSHDWPKLRQAHCAKYHVQRTYTHESLASLLADRGMELVAYSYQFRSRMTERLYLSLSAYGGRVGFNAAAPLTPLVALADRRSPNDQGSIVLIKARKNDV